MMVNENEESNFPSQVIPSRSIELSSIESIVKVENFDRTIENEGEASEANGELID
jgi:hypothetical protein